MLYARWYPLMGQMWTPRVLLLLLLLQALVLMLLQLLPAADSLHVHAGVPNQQA